MKRINNFSMEGTFASPLKGGTMDKKANWFWDGSTLEDMVKQQEFELAKQVVLGKADETTTFTLKSVIRDGISTIRLVQPLGGWFYYNADNGLVAVDLISNVSEKEKYKDRLRVERLKTTWKTAAADKTFVHEVLSLVPDISIKFESTLAKKIQTVAQQKEDERLAQCSEDIRKKYAGYYYKNFIKSMRMEDVIMVREKNLTNNAEEKVMQEQKKSEKMVMAPASKHMERMGVMEKEDNDVSERLEKCLDGAEIEVDYDIQADLEAEAKAMEVQEEMETLLEEIMREEKVTQNILDKRRTWVSYCIENGLETCEVVVGRDAVSEYEIVMRAIGNGKQRKYNLYERRIDNHKNRHCFLVDETTFKINEIMKDRTLLADVISSFYGDYERVKQDIISTVLNVERERVLTIFEMEDDSTIEEKVEDLKFYMISNPMREEFVHIKLKGKMEVGIIGDEEGYQRILDKLFPGYSVRKFNAELKAVGLLSITGNEGTRSTRNIEVSKAKALGLSRCKFYNFNFGEKFVKEYMVAYEEAKRAQEEVKND